VLYPLEPHCNRATAQEKKEVWRHDLYPANIDLESDEINLEDVCASEWAAYKQALDTVIDLDPDRLCMGGAGHSVSLLDDPVVRLFCAGWHAGVRAAQAASAGSGFAVPIVSCPRCYGHGRLWNGRSVRRVGAQRTVCPLCGGTDTVGSAGEG
jgi:hypothetical protein